MFTYILLFIFLIYDVWVFTSYYNIDIAMTYYKIIIVVASNINIGITYFIGLNNLNTKLFDTNDIFLKLKLTYSMTTAFVYISLYGFTLNNTILICLLRIGVIILSYIFLIS